MTHLTSKLMLLAFAALVMLASCEYENTVYPTFPEDNDTTSNDTTGNDTTVTVDTISFSQDIVPFFTSKCVSCHKGSVPPDLRADKAYSALMLGGYVVANQPENSTLYIKCKPGGSMAAYSSTSNLELLYRWIKAGAKNN